MEPIYAYFQGIRVHYSKDGRYISPKEAYKALDSMPRGYKRVLAWTDKNQEGYYWKKKTKTRTIVYLIETIEYLK